MKKSTNLTDKIVIITTLALFIVALFVKGLTKEILLEAGVLLVSIKLLLMNHKNALANQKTSEKLDKIIQELSEIKEGKH